MVDSCQSFIHFRPIYTRAAIAPPPPDSNVHGPHMTLSSPGGPHVGPMNLVIGATT